MSNSPTSSRWRALCAYDGTDFDGWQSQPSGNAIQDILEGRLAEIFKLPVRIHGSGRTDAGVHALGQVFHFDAVWPHAPGKLVTALRVGLPPTIQVKNVKSALPDFHARFSATGKRYTYRIHQGAASPFEQRFVLSRERPQKLDVSAMQAAAAILQGKHDFRAFAADNGTELENPVRDLRRLEVEESTDQLTLNFEADGFLYKMVRSLTGALLAVGEGRMAANGLIEILASGARTEKVETAPPQGLFLEEVFYDDDRG